MIDSRAKECADFDYDQSHVFYRNSIKASNLDLRMVESTVTMGKWLHRSVGRRFDLNSLLHPQCLRRDMAMFLLSYTVKTFLFLL